MVEEETKLLVLIAEKKATFPGIVFNEKISREDHKQGLPDKQQITTAQIILDSLTLTVMLNTY